ncbi:MAG: NAD(P)-dependent oxidoreductase [Bacteroidales bacterium]|nr:NAD(P)-dependent oxidoreductase [Bacteroidales bacterium]
MKTFLITGATSMIGIALIEYISSFDDNIIYAVCREGSDGIKRLPVRESVKIIFSEIQNITNVVKLVQGADIFINLAWTNTDHKGRNDAFLQGLNVDYAEAAIRAAAKVGCKLFVEAGSQAEYGFVKDLITESTPCNPEVEYGKAKLRVYEKGSDLCNSFGIKYLHLRIFSVFGKNDRPWTLIMSSIDKMLKNEDLHLSSCLQSWNYLYVTDCAKQIFLLCEHLFNKPSFKSGVYNIASNDTRRLKDFIEEMKLILKSSSRLIYGSLIPEKLVSLNPSTAKTAKAIGFINEVSFANGVKIIVSENYK